MPYNSEIDFESIFGNIGPNISCPICLFMKLKSETTMSLSDRIAHDHLNSGWESIAEQLEIFVDILFKPFIENSLVQYLSKKSLLQSKDALHSNKSEHERPIVLTGMKNECALMFCGIIFINIDADLA